MFTHQRLQIQFSAPDDERYAAQNMLAFNKLWNNKFYYKVVSCGLFLLIYRRILGPVYDNENENWRILTNKEIYAMVKKPTIIETIWLNRLRWFGHVQRMEENRIPKKVLYMNLGTTRF